MRIPILILFCLSLIQDSFSQIMQLDSAFGVNGYASYYFQARYDGAYDIALQNDGKIIMVGDATYSTATLIWEVKSLNPGFRMFHTVQ